MSDPKGQQEPTMEEILASIRRIISDDGEEVGKAPPATPEPSGAARPAAPAAPTAADEVLELTKVVAEDGSVVDLAAVDKDPAEPEPEAAPEPKVSAAPEPFALEEPVMAPPPEPPRPARSPVSPSAEADGLVSPPTAAAAASAFSGLTGALSTTRGWPLGNGQRTVEELVKELLRPMLKDWLDANLPSLVQRVVEREIAKLAGRAEDTRGS